MASFVVDQSGFPIVRFQYHDLLDDEEFELQLAALDRLLDAGRPFVLAVETYHQRMMPLRQVRRQAAHMKAREAQARACVLAIAMVIPSSVIRGVLKVVLSLAPMPVPYALFDEPGKAQAWAQEQLRKTSAAG